MFYKLQTNFGGRTLLRLICLQYQVYWISIVTLVSLVLFIFHLCNSFPRQRRNFLLATTLLYISASLHKHLLLLLIYTQDLKILKHPSFVELLWNQLIKKMSYLLQPITFVPRDIVTAKTKKMSVTLNILTNDMPAFHHVGLLLSRLPECISPNLFWPITGRPSTILQDKAWKHAKC